MTGIPPSSQDVPNQRVWGAITPDPAQAQPMPGSSSKGWGWGCWMSGHHFSLAFSAHRINGLSSLKCLS